MESKFGKEQIGGIENIQEHGKFTTVPEKKRKGMSLFYSTLEYSDIADSIPSFLMSKQTHELIHTVNTTKNLEALDLHVKYRENYINSGVQDTQQRIWKIFNDMVIEEFIIGDDRRKYIGELLNNRMQGFGQYIFLNRGQRYEGEFMDDNFDGYGVYVWQRERQYYEGEWKNGKQEGLGMFVKDGGIRYEGEFKDGKFEGHGCGKYINGDTYIGNWKDNSK